MALPGAPHVVPLAATEAEEERMALGAVSTSKGWVVLGGYSYPERRCSTSISLLSADGREKPAKVRLSEGRNFPLCVSLGGGRILAIGGYQEGADTLSSTEMIDLDRQASEPWGSLFDPVELATAESLPLELAVIGGLTSQGETVTRDTIQILDLRTHDWRLDAGRLHTSRFGHASIRLATGEILIAGGKHVDRVPNGRGTKAVYRPIGSVEIWNPKTGLVRAAGSLTTERDRPALWPMRDGSILVIGGQSHRGIEGSVELYNPRIGASRVVAHLSTPRMAAAVLPLGKRGLLISGGWVDDPERGRAIEYLDFATLRVVTVAKARVTRAEHAMIWLTPKVFALVGGKDAFRGRNPHSYRFRLTERFRVSL